ncbi:MAG: isopentenyl-diphosphate Delta-isomerase [Pararhodobacter sp.]
MSAASTAQRQIGDGAQLIPAWANGRLQPVEKLAVHQRGLRHQAISVFVMRGRQVLIQRRALGKYHTPGLWANTVCTHPHWGESHAACASRRLGEELGITGLPLHHAGVVEYRADVGDGLIEHEVVQIYITEAPPGMRLDPDPAEVMDTAWRDLDDLARETRTTPQHFTPWLRLYLAEHAETIFGAAAPAA